MQKYRNGRPGYYAVIYLLYLYKILIINAANISSLNDPKNVRLVGLDLWAENNIEALDFYIIISYHIMDTLYVFELKDDCVFLYPADSTRDTNTIMQDCSVLYEYIRIHPVIGVIDSIPIQDELDIDKHVKKYMRMKGFDQVRGGTYTDVVYPETVKQFVHKELSHSFDQYYRDIQILRSIEEKYSAALDVSTEMSNVLKKRDLFLALSKVAAHLSSVSVNTMNDLRWISTKLDTPVTEDDKVRYKNILGKLSQVYAVYTKIFNDKQMHYDTNAVSFTPNVYVYRPDFVLDWVFLHSHLTMHKEAKEKLHNTVRTLIEHFEYMFHFILNRLDEINESLQEFPDNYDYIVKYTLEYLHLRTL